MIIPLRYGPRVTLLPEPRPLSAAAVGRSMKERWWPRLRALFWWLTVAGWVVSAFCTVLADHEELPWRTRLLLALIGVSTMALDLLATCLLVWSLEPIEVPYQVPPEDAVPPESQPYTRPSVIWRDGGPFREPRP